MRMRKLFSGAPSLAALLAIALPALLSACAPPSGGDEGETPSSQKEPVVSENANDGVAFHYFVSKGLSEVQAAGIVGNLDQESGMDPTIWEIGGGPGRGIAQWSAGGRWDTDGNDNVVWYAATHGGQAWSLQTQLDFIWYELTTFGYGLSQLEAATDVTAATLAFMGKYEMCGACNSSNRIAHANAALAAFGSAPQSSSCGVQSDGLLHCNNKANTALYASASAKSAVVDHLQSMNSWFKCWGTGDKHAGGNTTWYYTQGDDHGAWGWVPAVNLDTAGSFDANPTAAGLPACDAPSSPQGGSSSGDSPAAIAMDNVGNTACGPNSMGGKGFESSCTGNGGQPEYWCADFVTWVWDAAGAEVGGLTAAAGSFYCYGQKHGTLSNTPHVGDAVVFDYQGNCWADHVAIVTQVNGDGSIVTVSGDWNGQSGSQAYFASTAHVVVNQPAFPGVVGSTAAPIGMTISGFISPVGIPASTPAAPPPGPEGSQAFLYPNQQHFLHGDAAGNVRHHWWDGNTKSVVTDTWGTGIAGRPVTFVDGTSQHVFARGQDGSLRHWFWDPVHGAGQDNWAPSAGLSGDPAALMIGDYQDVWAVDGSGSLQHWWWGPSTNGVRHDTWGSGAVGRPSAFVTNDGAQHVFARGKGGTLEHWWWTPGQGISHDTWGSGIAGDPAALAIGEFQGVWAVDSGGNLQHWWWGPSTGGVQHDTWGSGVVGRPSVALYGNGDQEVFVRGKGGTLEHFWWDAQLGISHDTWGTGIAGDPTAEIINAQQHVWAPDAAGHAQHWYWDPATSVIEHDDWGK